MNTALQSRALRMSVSLVAAFLVAACPNSQAATTEYQYDALGRLRGVSHDNQVQTTYTLDAAGNRTKVEDVTAGPPSAPSSLTLISPSSSGNFGPYWGSASGTVTRYELYESLSAAFSSQILVYSGGSLSVTIANRAAGTYYYRVRACNAVSCSGYTTAANPMVVSIPPPGPNPPTNPTKTFIANCAWRANWNPPVGGGAFTHYVVRDTVGSEQTVTATQASVGCQPNNQNSNMPKWVKACSATACSAQSTTRMESRQQTTSIALDTRDKRG